MPDLSGAREIECDVLIVGGGTGGVAAALAAARRGKRVHLLEETDWIGGQLTAQGISALDEHEHIESFGGTASYYQLRNALRDHYRAVRRRCAASSRTSIPGSCWVTRVAFEPKVAVDAMMAQLEPHIREGRLTLHLRTKVAAVETEGDRIVAVTAISSRRPPAPAVSDPRWLLMPPNSATCCRLRSRIRRRRRDHRRDRRAARPADVDPSRTACKASPMSSASSGVPTARSTSSRNRPDTISSAPSQPYSLRIEVHGGEIYGEDSGWLDYKLYDTMPGTKGGLWTYRRLIDSAHLKPRSETDLSMINWPGNDYRESIIIDRPAAQMAAALQDAKRVSLGFLHWLQTEAPATGDRRGAPELKLRPDIMGTPDGLAKFPYIRESRRIKALRTVVEQDVSAHYQEGARAAHFDDSVGVGWYPIDIHRAGPEDVGVSCRTRPFQIPWARSFPSASPICSPRPRTSARRTSPTAASDCTPSNGISARPQGHLPPSVSITDDHRQKSMETPL